MPRQQGLGARHGFRGLIGLRRPIEPVVPAMGIDAMPGRHQSGDQFRMLFHPDAAAEERRLCLSGFERRQEMRRALRIRPVIEGDGDSTFAAALRVEAPNDR